MRVFLKIILLLAVLAIPILNAQENNSVFRLQAELLSKEGRYGEAIDQLNKFIAQNPRLADGYHQRGLCFEKRSEYQNSVLDLRRAIRLTPENKKIREDLNRVISIWHKLLYQKIEGHKRDIAKDPNYAFSYLEIGKSYRWLEEWPQAEYWYDEYLKRDDNASPDEIVRYTEILAKTGSIVKGERILKKFTDRYPDDNRLWSRYGYFTLWLGKNKIAENAFVKALDLKPFFKEAQDGLDLARRHGYLTQFQGKAFEYVEYPIDRYYRLLDKSPDDDNTRFTLVEELIKVNRYEDAYQQMQYLQLKNAESDKYKSLLKIITDYRDSTYNQSVSKNTEILKADPSNKEAVLKLAEAYGNLFYYDSAIEVLNEYLQDLKDDQDLGVRFKYAQYLAWNYEWEKSIQQLNNLLKLDPENLDYQLLRGQIAVWTLNDLEMGEQYLLNVHSKKENDIDAMFSLVNLYTWKRDFSTAKVYLDLLKSKFPNNLDVMNMESTYQLRLQAYEETKIFEIKGEAGKLVLEGKCVEALVKYDEYLEKRKSLTNDEKLEYADIATCAKDFNKAIKLYSEVLESGFDFKIALLRAQNYFSAGDTTLAKRELESLTKLNPEDSQAKIWLADTYAATKKLEEAEKIYRAIKESTQDQDIQNDIDQKLIFLGGYYIEDKQYEKGKDIYLEILKNNPSPDFTKQIDQRLIFLADKYVSDKKYDEAENEFKELEEKFTDSEKLNDIYKRQIYMGYLLTSDKELSKAEDLFDDLTEKVKTDSLKVDLNQKKMFLADAYVADESYGSARSIYEDLIDKSTDSTEIKTIKERIGWLPPSGFVRGLRGIGSFLNYFIPTNFNLAPFATYYKDNHDFRFWNYGGRFEAGFAGFLSLGVMWNRITQDNNYFQKDFTQLKGIGTIYISKYFSVSGGYGKMATLGEVNYRIWDAQVKFEIPKELSLSLSYDNTDARLFLYSPYLLLTRLSANWYRFNYEYSYKDIMKLYGFYNYFDLSDGNKGNDFQIRIGKKFLNLILFGYEYFFSDYKYSSILYYSPQEFYSHSLWAEYQYQLDKEWKFKIGGKLGYAPNVDFILSDAFGEVVYNPLTYLIVTGRASVVNSFRYETGYKSFNLSLSAYLAIF